MKTFKNRLSKTANAFHQLEKKLQWSMATFNLFFSKGEFNLKDKKPGNPILKNFTTSKIYLNEILTSLDTRSNAHFLPANS